MFVSVAAGSISTEQACPKASRYREHVIGCKLAMPVRQASDTCYVSCRHNTFMHFDACLSCTLHVPTSDVELPRALSRVSVNI